MTVSPLSSSSTWLNIEKDSDFSLDNIPFGVCSLSDNSTRRCVTAIGNHVVDLDVLQSAGAFSDIDNLDGNVFSNDNLNDFMSHPCEIWSLVRQRLVDLFSGRNDLLKSNEALQKAAFHDPSAVTMHLPAKIGDYTDFYSSREHATNVGTMFRGKDNALQPNWLHLPVGYHGRASTVYVSGQPIVRPYGQLQMDATDPKKGSTYGPCKLLDFELEVAFFVGGPPNQDGPINMENAKKRIFGFCLMNDWSARDIQKWEYVPLGPFTAKNFATSISPWIVTSEALEPFMVPTSAKVQDNPTPLDYLQDPNYSSYDIQLSVAIQSQTMKQPHVVCRSNFANLYWNAAQQLVHHSVTGCVMNPGDLLASGTISGQSQDSFGSMLELSWKGSREVSLSNEEKRKFLKDGDVVIMKGHCTKEGHGRVGFGMCEGKVLPSGSTTIPKVPETTLLGRYQNFKLYSYWRSSSSWRVRIALAAKGVPYETIAVDLKKGEQKEKSFVEKNPLGQVPVLEFTDTQSGNIVSMTQSVAIIEFLEQTFPKSKNVFPKDPMDKIESIEIVETINSGIQPLQNAPMVKKLEQASDGKIVAVDFAKDAITQGLTAVDIIIARRQKRDKLHGPYCLGGFSPTIADICLIPQLYNARRFGINVTDDFPRLAKIEDACATHPWFVPAHANVQIDAEE